MKRSIEVLAAAVASAVGLFGQTAEFGPVEFNRDIRPILSDRCYTCHGPSSTTRKSKLRFDLEASAKQDMGGHYAIMPGDPARSTLLARISAGDKPLRMPPPATGPALSEKEIGLIRAWIQQGAVWEKHWSFLPPKRLPTPAGIQPIDSFVRARLAKEGLQPAPEADRATLLRRVSFDLTGLPPALAELDAFLADRSPNAYERVVDRLLSSPRFGERMAVRWLDAARYADTNGYQTDGERQMWRWRDWVIDAFNHNMPYDRFAIEQLAGDLLPNPTLDQRLATGFNRNHRGNGEGGIVPEEYAVEYVVDRVDTTSTVFLGLTAGCARCHDHKYDPISQKEYYQLYAYFNSIPERGNAQKYGNSPPLMKAPTAIQKAELDRLSGLAEVREFEFNRDFKGFGGPLPKESEWADPRGLAVDLPLAGESFDGTRTLEKGNVANYGFLDRFTISVWINPAAPDGVIVSRAKGEEEPPGWSLQLKDGRIQANFVLRWLDDAGRVETRDPIELNKRHHIAFTYDGSRFAEGMKIYVDGVERPLKVHLDQINQNFAVAEPLRVGAHFRGTIENLRIYGKNMDSAQVRAMANPRAPESLRMLLLSRMPAWNLVLDAREARDGYLDTIQTAMVMEELPKPVPAFVLNRGSYERPGAPVERGIPAALPSMPPGVTQDRLALAKWIASPENPLAARVAVNRYWQMYFGTGIVKTVEDFGSQGEWPSHPELLDWLATEFVRTGWDVKALQKTIVMSETYRQSSKASPDLIRRDPENRLLARGPRIRLAAEMVRDQALAVSGLLVEKVGGPSVKPYQPAGLWRELSGGEDYKADSGEALYRRGMYTFWKRAVPPPMMANFDSAGREACTVRETRTNTPLQALDLMNDVTFIEAARNLAQRMMKDGGVSEESRVAYAFRLATSRRPDARESGILLNSYNYNLDRFRSDPALAEKLLAQGESKRDPSLDSAQLAANAAVASLILNLDEVVTRQ